MTLADPFQAEGFPDAGCVCGGGGTVFVDEDYVTRHAAHYRDEAGNLPPGTLEALRFSVIPCHDCRPEQYQDWATGKLGRSHRKPRPAGGHRRHRP